jgi:hypothetical protein
MTLGHFGLFDYFASLFVGGDFANASGVTLVVRERFGNERLDEFEYFALFVLSCSNRDYIGVVV